MICFSLAKVAENANMKGIGNRAIQALYDLLQTVDAVHFNIDLLLLRARQHYVGRHIGGRFDASNEIDVVLAVEDEGVEIGVLHQIGDEVLDGLLHVERPRRNLHVEIQTGTILLGRGLDGGTFLYSYRARDGAEILDSRNHQTAMTIKVGNEIGLGKVGDVGQGNGGCPNIERHSYIVSARWYGEDGDDVAKRFQTIGGLSHNFFRKDTNGNDADRDAKRCR